MRPIELIRSNWTRLIGASPMDSIKLSSISSISSMGSQTVATIRESIELCDQFDERNRSNCAPENHQFDQFDRILPTVINGGKRS